MLGFKDYFKGEFMFHDKEFHNLNPMLRPGQYVRALFPLRQGTYDQLFADQIAYLVSEKPRPAIIFGRAGDLVVAGYQTTREIRRTDRHYFSVEGHVTGLPPSHSNPNSGPFISRDCIVALPADKIFFPNGLEVIGEMDPKFFSAITKYEIKWPDRIPFPRGPLPPGTIISKQAKTLGGFLRRNAYTGEFLPTPH